MTESISHLTVLKIFHQNKKKIPMVTLLVCKMSDFLNLGIKKCKRYRITEKNQRPPSAFII